MAEVTTSSVLVTQAGLLLKSFIYLPIEHLPFAIPMAHRPDRPHPDAQSGIGEGPYEIRPISTRQISGPCSR